MNADLINLSDADVLTQHKDKVLNCTMLDTEVLAYENQDEEAVAMAEESSSRVEMTTDHPGTYALPTVDQIILFPSLYCYFKDVICLGFQLY